MTDEMGAVARDHAERHLGRDDRRVEQFGERANVALRAARDRATPRHNDRTPRCAQKLDRRLDVARGWPRPAGRPVAPRGDVELHVVEGAARREYVLRNVEMHGTGPAGQSFAKRTPG